MGALTAAGGRSKTVIFQHESHKLHIVFTVAAGQTIKRGQPVKLTNDGKVTAWVKADLNHLILGYAVTDATEGNDVTIMMKAFLVIYAMNGTAGALNAGNVTYQGYNEANNNTETGLKGYSLYSAPTGATGNTETHGWNLDQVAAQYALIRVAVS